MSNHSSSIFQDRKDFAAFSAWIISCLVLAILTLIYFGHDFIGYFAAAKVLLIGGNPYDYNQVAPIIVEITGSFGSHPYYYIPWFAWLITPLALLPFNIARIFWMMINFIFWISGLLVSKKLFDWPDRGWKRWLLYLYATFSFVLITWRFEQVGGILFTLLIAAMVSIKSKKWFWAGVYLSLLLIKPNITLILFAVIIIWLMRQGLWKPIITTGIILTSLLLLTTIATPDWFQPLLKPGFGNGLFYFLQNPDEVVGIRLNTTLVDWLIMMGLERNVSYVINIIGLIIGIFCITWVIVKSQSLMKYVVISIIVTFAITPYAVQYDYPLLTLPIFWSLAEISQKRGFRIVGYSICVFIASVVIWEHPISDGYWMVIGVIVLVVFGWITALKNKTLPSGEQLTFN